MAFRRSFLLGARLKASCTSARAWLGPARWVDLMEPRCEMDGCLHYKRGCDKIPFSFIHEVGEELTQPSCM